MFFKFLQGRKEISQIPTKKNRIKALPQGNRRVQWRWQIPVGIRCLPSARLLAGFTRRMPYGYRSVSRSVRLLIRSRAFDTVMVNGMGVSSNIGDRIRKQTLLPRIKFPPDSHHRPIWQLSAKTRQPQRDFRCTHTLPAPGDWPRTPKDPA